MHSALDAWIIERCRGALLEIGCGTGRFLIAAAGRAWPMIGIDSSLPMISRAAERGLPFLIHAVADRLPIRNASFDTIVSVRAWCFVPDAGYREVARMLRAGGSFIYQLDGAVYVHMKEIGLWLRYGVERFLSVLNLNPRPPPIPRRVRSFAGLWLERRRLRKVGLRLISAKSVPRAAQPRSKLRRLLATLAGRWPCLSADVVVVAEAG